MPGSILGNAVARVEDPELLTGAARYVEDVEIPGALHAVFVRSALAHARITGIDTADAAAMPGVAGVYTAADLGLDELRGMRIFPEAMRRMPLATDAVRFVGEAVAVVIAETRAQAADAAELVAVDYDPLPVVASPEAALAPDAPLLFPEAGTNVAFAMGERPSPDTLEGADVVARGRFVNQRLAAVPMEGNAIAAVPDPGSGGLTVWVPSQHPFGVRGSLARALELDEEKIRVIVPAMGGGFGAKAGMYAEHLVVCELARRLGRPVRWVESRSENLVALTQGRAQIQEVEIGARRDGTIVGLNAHIIADAGAYPAIGAVLPTLTRIMGSGVYRIERIDVTAQSVVTNTTPTSAYRGAGRPEATALVERAMDLVAAELGMDPVEVRRRNLIPADAFPYNTPTGARYDSGNYEGALDRALEIAGYEELRREQAERRVRGDTVQLGIGVSIYVEITAGGPFDEFGSVEVHEDGTVTVMPGTSSHGQGHATAYAQIVSHLLGVPMDVVRVVQSDTGVVPKGQGTYGSRSVQLGGSAIFKAGEAVLDKAKQIAAHLLEAAPEDVVLHDGGLGVAGVPDTAIDWGSLAKAAAGPDGLPEGMEPGLRADADFDQGMASFPFGCHIAVAEVDVETGEARLRRHIAVDDSGRIVNPLLAEGQVHGGIGQGVAQALYEAVLYDEDANPLTGTLATYAFPAASELPSFETERTETPSPLNPLGAKGIGESGTIGSTPAVQNAVVDAVAHLGVRHIDMPLTPERVWRAIHAGGMGGRSE